MSEQRKKFLDDNCHINLYKDDFKLSGWYIEYHTVLGSKSKFIGMITVSEPDRMYVGYNGRKIITGKQLPKKLYKRIYDGLEVTSILYPIYK